MFYCVSCEFLVNYWTNNEGRRRSVGLRKTGIIMLLWLVISGFSFSQDAQEDASGKKEERSDAEVDQSPVEQDVVKGEEVEPDEEKEIPETPEK